MSGPPPQETPLALDTGLHLVRALFPAIKKELSAEGCVLLVGPYEVGKSILARELAKDFGPGAYVLNGSNPDDRDTLKGDSGLVRNSRGKLIVIDEIHSFPEALDLIRAEVQHARASRQAIGQFLVLGSVPTEAERLTAGTLGTDSRTFRLNTISLAELPRANTPQLATTRTFAADELGQTVPIARANIAVPMQTLWIRGGFLGEGLPVDLASIQINYLDLLRWAQDGHPSHSVSFFQAALISVMDHATLEAICLSGRITMVGEKRYPDPRIVSLSSIRQFREAHRIASRTVEGARLGRTKIAERIASRCIQLIAGPPVGGKSFVLHVDEMRRLVASADQ